MTEEFPKVLLADGTELTADAGYANGDLWIWMKNPSKGNKDFLKIARLFADPVKTAEIRYMVTPDMEQTWQDMTQLTTVNLLDGKLRVRMRKGEANE